MASAEETSVTLLIRELFESSPPSSEFRPLAVDAFLDREAMRLPCPPSAVDCSLRVHRRAIFDSVNEALTELGRAPPPKSSISRQLDALKAGLGAPNALPPPSVASVEHVIQSLRSSGVMLGEVGVAATSTEDLGQVVLKAWERLSSLWGEPRPSELADAVAADDTIMDDDEESRDEGMQRAREAFWQARDDEILASDELHQILWSALSEFVSPPFPTPEVADPARTPHPTHAALAACAHLSLARRAQSDTPDERLLSLVPTPHAAQEVQQAAQQETDKKKIPGMPSTDGEEQEANEEDADGAASAEGGEEGDETARTANSAVEERPWEHHGWINYEDYLQALERVEESGVRSERLGPLRSAVLFLSLRLDEYGRASIRSLYRVAASLAQLMQTRVHLAMLDDGSGRLGEPALETFVQESIPRLDQLRDHVHLQPDHSFLPFFIAHCVRKLLLLLDTRRKVNAATPTHAPCLPTHAPCLCPLALCVPPLVPCLPPAASACPPLNHRRNPCPAARTAGLHSNRRAACLGGALQLLCARDRRAAVSGGGGAELVLARVCDSGLPAVPGAGC